MIRYGAQRARLLRPRCIVAERPRTQLLIYLPIHVCIHSRTFSLHVSLVPPYIGVSLNGQIACNAQGLLQHLLHSSVALLGSKFHRARLPQLNYTLVSTHHITQAAELANAATNATQPA